MPRKNQRFWVILLTLIFVGAAIFLMVAYWWPGTVLAPTVKPTVAVTTSPTHVAVSPEQLTGSRGPTEHLVVNIPLAGEAHFTYLEGSGLAWYRDQLILLPQYPDLFSSAGDGSLFAIPKTRLLSFLAGENKQPILPQRIPLFSGGIEKQIEGFEGYEAITFDGDRAYLTIEASPTRDMLGHVVAGRMAPDLSALRLDPTTVQDIPPQAHLNNTADEALLVVDGKVVTFYEANGANVNPIPKAHLFDLNLHSLGTLPFPTIEYRLTDVTAPDAAGRFWAMNFFYPGDKGLLKPAVDKLAEEYGQGPTHARFTAVERLVEFRYTPAGVVRIKTPPLQLQLIDNDHSRNWEGIARLDDKGFLLLTDTYPKTILGFVAEK